MYSATSRCVPAARKADTQVLFLTFQRPPETDMNTPFQQFEDRGMTKPRTQIEIASFRELDADELKHSVREMLILMEALERKLFIKTLEYEMFHSGLSIRSYLIPLGIAAECAEDLTPTDVGHLIKYFRINVPKAMLAVVRVLAGCPVLATGSELMIAWLLKATGNEACD